MKIWLSSYSNGNRLFTSTLVDFCSLEVLKLVDSSPIQSTAGRLNESTRLLKAELKDE